MVGGGGPNRTDDGYYVSQAEIELEWVKHYGETCPYADPLPLVSQLQRKELARRRREEKAAHLCVLEGPAERQEAPLPQATRTGPAACQQPPQTQSSQLAKDVDANAQRARSARRPRAVGRTRKKKPISRIDRDVRASREAEALVLRRLQEAITYAERVLPKLYGRTSASQADSAELPALPAQAEVHGTRTSSGAQRVSGEHHAVYRERPATVKTAPAPMPAKAETATRVGRAGRLAMPSAKRVVPEQKVESEKRTTPKHGRKRLVEKVETERVQTEQAGSHSRERVHVSEQQTDRAPPAAPAPQDDAPDGQAPRHDAQPSATDRGAALPSARQETEPVAHPAEQLPSAGEAQLAEQEGGEYEAESFEEEVVPSAVIPASHAHDLSTNAPLAAGSHGDEPLHVHAEVPTQPVVKHAEVPASVSQTAMAVAATNRAGHNARDEDEGEYAAEFEEEKEQIPRTATVTERAVSQPAPASLTSGERAAAHGEQVNAPEVFTAQTSQAVPSKEGTGDNEKEFESKPLSIAAAVEGREALVDVEEVMSTRSLAPSEVESTVLSPAHVVRESVRAGSQNAVIPRRLSTDGYESECFDEETCKAEDGITSGTPESDESLAEKGGQDGSIHTQPVLSSEYDQRPAIATSDSTSPARELEQAACPQPEQQPPTEAEASGRAPFHEHVAARDRSITASLCASQGVDGLMHADAAALYSPTHEPQTDAGATSNPPTSLLETASVPSRTPSNPADNGEVSLRGAEPHSRTEHEHQAQVEVEAPRSSQPAQVPASAVVEGQAEVMVPSTEGQPADLAISSGTAPTDDTRARGDSAAKVAALGTGGEVDVKQDTPVRPPSDLLKAIRDKPALRPVPAKVDAAQAENEAMEKEQRLQDKLRRTSEALVKLQTFLQDQALVIPFEGLTVDEEESRLLGRGRKARVYTADLCLHGVTQVVAVKEFEYDRARHMQPPTAVVESCAREVKMLHKLHHPAILTLLGAQVSPSGGLRVVTELIQRSLHDLICDTASWSRLDSVARFKVLRDVLSGLSAMHELCMVHRDIKSHNILVGQDRSHQCLSAKIADLGAARMLGEDEAGESDECGTSGWTAPEVLRCDAYDAKADVFSFGVVMWEVLCGCSTNPLSSLSVERLCDELVMVGPKGSRLPIPEDTPPAARALLHDCLRVEPGLRPTSSEALRRLDDIINRLVPTKVSAPTEPAAAEEQGLRVHQDAHAVQSEKQQPEVMVSAAVEQQGTGEEGAEEQDYDDFEPEDEEPREDAPVVAVPATTYHPAPAPARKDEEVLAATAEPAQPTAVAAQIEAPVVAVVQASGEALYAGVDGGKGLTDEQEDEYTQDGYDESEDHVKHAPSVSGHGGSVQSAEGDSAYSDDDIEE